MPLAQDGAHFPYAREALFALLACAQAGNVEHGGRYDARGGVLHVWSHPWSTQALRKESTLVGRVACDWLTDRLAYIEWDEGFELADLLHELAMLAEQALGVVTHGHWCTGW